MPFRSAALAVLVPLLWGAQYAVIKVGLVAFPPLFFVALRFAAITMLLVPFVGRPSGREWSAVAIVSLFMGGLNFGLTFAGLAHGRAGLSSVVNQLSAPFMVLLAWPVLGERPSAFVAGGVALAFAGVASMVVGGRSGAEALPVLLVAGAGLALAIGSVLTKLWGPFKPLRLMGWMSLFTVPQVLAVSLLLEHGQLASLKAASLQAWAALAYTIMLGGIAGFGLWFWLIDRYSMAQVAPFALLQIPFAVGAGIVWLGEPLSWRIVLGIALCAAGVLMTQHRIAPRAAGPVAATTIGV